MDDLQTTWWTPPRASEASTRWRATRPRGADQQVHGQGLRATQLLGTVFDGIARHTPEGDAFQQRAAEAGFRQAVRERDEPFGDAGRSTFKG